MATLTAEQQRHDDRPLGRVEYREAVDETKLSFKTTEFLAFIATVAGVFIASAIDDSIDARLAWILASGLAVGYMVSRGLAKSGSSHHQGSDTI